jgi:hypothetical protein
MVQRQLMPALAWLPKVMGVAGAAVFWISGPKVTKDSKTPGVTGLKAAMLAVDMIVAVENNHGLSAPHQIGFRLRS